MHCLQYSCLVFIGHQTNHDFVVGLLCWCRVDLFGVWVRFGTIVYPKEYPESELVEFLDGWWGGVATWRPSRDKMLTLFEAAQSTCLFMFVLVFMCLIKFNLHQANTSTVQFAYHFYGLHIIKCGIWQCSWQRGSSPKRSQKPVKFPDLLWQFECWILLERICGGCLE